jgi:hypothetical protein
VLFVVVVVRCGGSGVGLTTVRRRQALLVTVVLSLLFCCGCVVVAADNKNITHSKQKNYATAEAVAVVSRVVLE